MDRLRLRRVFNPHQGQNLWLNVYEVETNTELLQVVPRLENYLRRFRREVGTTSAAGKKKKEQSLVYCHTEVQATGLFTGVWEVPFTSLQRWTEIRQGVPYRCIHGSTRSGVACGCSGSSRNSSKERIQGMRGQSAETRVTVALSPLGAPTSPQLHGFRRTVPSYLYYAVFRASTPSGLATTFCHAALSSLNPRVLMTLSRV